MNQGKPANPNGWANHHAAFAPSTGHVAPPPQAPHGSAGYPSAQMQGSWVGTMDDEPPHVPAHMMQQGQAYSQAYAYPGGHAAAPAAQPALRQQASAGGSGRSGHGSASQQGQPVWNGQPGQTAQGGWGHGQPAQQGGHEQPHAQQGQQWGGQAAHGQQWQQGQGQQQGQQQHGQQQWQQAHEQQAQWGGQVAHGQQWQHGQGQHHGQQQWQQAQHGQQWQQAHEQQAQQWGGQAAHGQQWQQGQGQQWGGQQGQAQQWGGQAPAHAYPAAPPAYGASQSQYPQGAQPNVMNHLATLSTRAARSGDGMRSHVDATAGKSDRVRFIRLTYLHLFAAVLAFAGLEYLLMTNAFLGEKISAPFIRFALGGRWNWGVVLAVFVGVSWICDQWATHARSRGMQYLGLGVYVVAEALIFVPLLAIVAWKTQAIIARGGGHPNIIRDAAYATLAIFAALTASVFVTKKDFSFLRSALMMGSAAAMVLIILSLSMGFGLGLIFSVAMVLLAAGYILYQTSQILAHYDPRNYVAAALALFSSLALMFWYIIRIFLRARD